MAALFSLLASMIINAGLSNLFILRNECIADGIFDVTHPGKILYGAVLTTTHHNEDDCETACLMESRCKSVNVKTVGGYGCELNSKIVGDIETNFMKRTGWEYKSTNFSAKEFGPFCRKSNPCNSSSHCISTCHCNGYKCYPCHEMKYGLQCEEAVRKFVIVNALGNCTAYDVSLKILKIFSACDSFELTPNNRLKHSSSGKCVVPVGIFNNASLTLHGNCNDINSIFQQTQTLQLKHTNSEMCISTQGDKSNRLDSLNVTKLTIDVRCDNRQEGAFKMVPDCDTKFKKIRGVRGRPCFKINTKNRLLTKLILQDRDKTTETYSGVTINWKNWNNYFADFICRCAKRVKQNGGKVFGIQNYGECWTETDKNIPNAYSGIHSADGCKSFGYKICKDTDFYCVGRENHEFVYKMIE